MNEPHQIKLSAEKWEEVWSLFDQCLPLAAPAREVLLREATKGKPWLKLEVESLLDKNPLLEKLLETPLLVEMSGAEPPSIKVSGIHPEISWQPLRLGKYLLLQRLGRGGMAEVFLAKMLGPNGYERLVAVKRILPEYAADSEMKSFFENEAKLSSRLNHANIVHIYDFGESEGTYLLAMEYVNGVNLAEFIRKMKELNTPIPLEFSLYIMARVAEALDYAHHTVDELTGKPLSIIHRDITPKNVMLSFEGNVKIVDFGIAKVQEKAHLTRTGFLRGTTSYLSPEMVSGKKIDARSDVFSTCAVLYELLSGSPLFDSDDLFAIMRQIQDDRFVLERLENLNLEERLKTILLHGLTQSPETRIPIGQLRNELDSYLTEHFAPKVASRISLCLRAAFKTTIDSKIKNLEEANSLSLQTVRISRKQIASKRQVFFITLTVAAVLFSLKYSPWNRPTERTPAQEEETSVVLRTGPCGEEVNRYCPGMGIRGGYLCLMKFESSLSNLCRTFLQTKTCAYDIEKLCPNLSNWERQACLKEKRELLSESCKNRLDSK